jgi:hypothetical protein
MYHLQRYDGNNFEEDINTIMGDDQSTIAIIDVPKGYENTPSCQKYVAEYQRVYMDLLFLQQNIVSMTASNDDRIEVICLQKERNFIVGAMQTGLPFVEFKHKYQKGSMATKLMELDTNFRAVA